MNAVARPCGAFFVDSADETGTSLGDGARAREGVVRFFSNFERHRKRQTVFL
jgi:hypothetical protein